MALPLHKIELLREKQKRDRYIIESIPKELTTQKLKGDTIADI